MDTRKSIEATYITHHPAYLFIGASDFIFEKTLTLLQNFFCSQKQSQACQTCTGCRKVSTFQHESIMWLDPEKQYTIQDLQPIFSTISYALEPSDHYFFVLQKAQTLGLSCSNALLKSLEEPPRGYHFILLSQRADLILPTIKSRCMIYQQENMPAHYALASLRPFFTTVDFQDPIAFLKELETLNPTEWECFDFLDQLIWHWTGQYKKAINNRMSKEISDIQSTLAILHNALGATPMAGGGKLFLKNLFLQIKRI